MIGALGISARQAHQLLREARATAGRRPTVLVEGPLAAELARALTAGGDTGAVRVGGALEGAAGYVRVLAGAPDGEAVSRLRRAARLGVPTVAVQTASEQVDVPYVLADDVVGCRPGAGFDVEAVGRALARGLGHDAVGLAAALPSVRGAATEALVSSAALRGALLGGLPWIEGARFPLLTPVQARLALDLAAAHGRAVEPQERAPELGAVLGLALAARALGRALRRAHVPGPLAGALTGYGATRALGEAAARRLADG